VQPLQQPPSGTSLSLAATQSEAEAQAVAISLPLADAQEALGQLLQQPHCCCTLCLVNKSELV